MSHRHHIIHYLMPILVIVPENPMFLRGCHDWHDSRNEMAIKWRTSFKPLKEEQRALFKDRFNVDDALVRAAF